VPLTATAGLLMTLSPGYLGQRWLLAFPVVGGLTMIWGTILWSLRRGNVIVIGTAETELRDALRHALHRLSLPYQESARSFVLLGFDRRRVTLIWLLADLRTIVIRV
jgi:hypothetical protein